MLPHQRVHLVSVHRSLTAFEEGLDAASEGFGLGSVGGAVALAALSESDGSPERFTAGELTIQRGASSAAARCLRGQAELLMMPYVRDCFAFLGV